MQISKPLVSPEVFRILNTDPDSIPVDDAMLYADHSGFGEDQRQPIFGMMEQDSDIGVGGGVCSYTEWFYDGEDSDLTH